MGEFAFLEELVLLVLICCLEEIEDQEVALHLC